MVAVIHPALSGPTPPTKSAQAITPFNKVRIATPLCSKLVRSPPVVQPTTSRGGGHRSRINTFAHRRRRPGPRQGFAVHEVQFRSCARSGGRPEPFGTDGARLWTGLVPYLGGGSGWGSWALSGDASVWQQATLVSF